jgi:hypothetical protein
MGNKKKKTMMMMIEEVRWPRQKSKTRRRVVK